MAHSTLSPASGQSKTRAKAGDKFPLTLRADGRYQKQVHGRIHYFGGSADEALAEWLRVKDDLLAGREPAPRPDADATTIAHAVNHWLTYKRRRVESGELAERTWQRYYATGEMLIDTLGGQRALVGLRPDDFERLRDALCKRYSSPIVLAVEIQAVRSILKHAYDDQLIDVPVRTGKGFAKPAAKFLRKRRAEKGPKLYTAAEVWQLIEAARPNMRAMIYLALNCGFGPGDLAALTLRQCDGTQEWLEHPRPKTGIDRRIPLWPDTRKAIKEAIEQRRQPKEPADAGLLFIGRRGTSYRDDAASYRVSAEFADIRKLTTINSARTFYDFRRTFQTVSENSRDSVAVRAIMGHAPPTDDMSSIYRQRIDDDRLVAVVAVVRKWLMAGKPKKRKAARNG